MMLLGNIGGFGDFSDSNRGWGSVGYQIPAEESPCSKEPCWPMGSFALRSDLCLDLILTASDFCFYPGARSAL